MLNDLEIYLNDPLKSFIISKTVYKTQNRLRSCRQNFPYLFASERVIFDYINRNNPLLRLSPDYKDYIIDIIYFSFHNFIMSNPTIPEHLRDKVKSLINKRLNSYVRTYRTIGGGLKSNPLTSLVFDNSVNGDYFLKEYDLILQKKSELPRSKRDVIEYFVISSLMKLADVDSKENNSREE